MEAHFPIYVVVMLHVGFALAVSLCRGNERFSRLFATSWLIEALRAAILLPEVHNIGGTFHNEWFGLAEVLSFFATAFLVCSGAALMGQRLSKKLIILYVCIGVPTVVLGRYFGPKLIEGWFSVSFDDASFFAVLFNLVVMFVPFTIARLIFAWWLYLTWNRERDAGAFIALVFGFVYAIVAISVPVQFYFSWNPPWMFYVWCIKLFGFSMGMMLLTIGSSEKRFRESNDRLRKALSQLELAQQQASGRSPD